MKNVLIILTNIDRTERNKLATGFHFAEFSHAYEFFKEHGYSVTVASPKGGKCTITSDYPGDKINAAFKKDPNRMEVIEKTLPLSEVEDIKFDVVYIAGGHGAMFDLPDNKSLGMILNNTYANGGLVAAVCHGPAAFVGVKAQDGSFLIQGKHITSFTNDEEKATALFGEMPFFLQTKLTEQGARFEKSNEREPHLTIDSRLVTGQNPESIELVLGALHALLVK